MDVNNVKSDNDTKKITFVLVTILVLMVTTTSATYAWLALTATATNNITGTVASGGLAFQLSNNANTTSGVPSLIKPTGSAYTSAPMIPQLAYSGSTNILQKAVTGVKPTGGSAVVPCVDSNGNVVCRVYTFTIRNNATAKVQVNGRIYFTNAPTNLRWALMTNATTVAVTGTTTDKNFRSPKTSANCAATTATTDTDCWFDIGSDESDGIVGRTLAPSGGASSTSAASGSYRQYWIVFWINETGAVQNDSGTWTATIAFTSSNGTGITSTINS